MLKYSIILLSLISFSSGNTLRIVNGTDTVNGEFPYMVALYRWARALQTYIFFCGASIIDPNWILTAAHCVLVDNPNDVLLVYGTNDITTENKNQIIVSKVYYHEHYNQITYQNDIALLYLEKPLTFNNFINKINLPEQDFIAEDNASVVLTGWGINETNNVDPVPILQKVELNIVSYNKCSNIHLNVFDTQICAMHIDGGLKGQCSGDSGGPLVKENIQVGIVSWSIKPCGVYPYPGVFTRVSAYRNWIDHHIWKLNHK